MGLIILFMTSFDSYVCHCTFFLLYMNFIVFALCKRRHLIVSVDAQFCRSLFLLLSHFPTDIFTGFYCVKTSAIDLDFNMMCRMVSISVQTFFLEI